MRKLLATIALAALMAGAATSAQAQDGWYGRVDAGYGFDGELEVEDYYIEEEISPQQHNSSTSFGLENGWMGDVGLGYGWGNGFRAEAELAYRSNDVEDVDEEVTATSALLNLLYDFNREGKVRPYVGAGVGYAQVEAGDEDESNWAWQGLAGLGFPINSQLTFDLGYRYFTVPELEVDGGFRTVDAEYTHQAVTVGLRYQFAAPPAPPPPPPPQQPVSPPPPPPPVACPTSEFVVYFEWDRSNLNQAAMDTIDQAVTRARQCNISSVTIVGHTDTSGSTAYNQGLSERRASVVRDALVARGMSAQGMTTQARGETDLARATRDGVREPLNRRTAVTILFR
ncbi:MAG: OmpA family protein [Hyphomonadaceae bacterium]|nr:OmpA family protein [Hyphomonadaceae bacterium]